MERQRAPSATLRRKIPSRFFSFLEGPTESFLGHTAQRLSKATLWVEVGGGESLCPHRVLWPRLAITGTSPAPHAHLTSENHYRVLLPLLCPFFSLKSLTHQNEKTRVVWSQPLTPFTLEITWFCLPTFISPSGNSSPIPLSGNHPFLSFLSSFYFKKCFICGKIH